MSRSTAPFADRIEAFFAEFFPAFPVHATAAGMHDFDAVWPDLSAAGTAARCAFVDRWEAELRTWADEELTADERIDRDLLLGELDGIRFEETELRELDWNPLEWNYLIGFGLFPLLARDYAPLADRLVGAAGRLEGIPDVLAAARERLAGVPGVRPVARLHTETALERFPGIDELADDAVVAAEAGAAADPAVAAILPRVRAAALTAKTALASFQAHLRDVVLPTAVGEGRLGAELFATKLRHTLKDATLTPARVLARAELEAAAVRAEMVRLAEAMWPAWCPGRERPTDHDVLVREVLDAIAVEHPAADGLLDFCRAELARIEAFCRERDLVGPADEPLEIRWTPGFLASFGGAMLDSPGVLDRGQKAFFAITPIPVDWTAEQAESHLREDNDRQLRLLTIHEAVPGHYLQGVWANRCPSLARAVFGSGVYAEGWAVYVTQVMMDLGYGADDPALRLSHWKYYLRAILNAVIDVRIHAGEAVGGPLAEDEAVRLMIEGGFQEEAEARAKWNRARLSSTQLSTYFLGSMAMWELERDVRRRRAAASADPRGALAVVERGLPGGFGETPGFRYREHLEAVMAPAALPIPLLRRTILGD